MRVNWHRVAGQNSTPDGQEQDRDRCATDGAQLRTQRDTFLSVAPVPDTCAHGAMHPPIPYLVHQAETHLHEERGKLHVAPQQGGGCPGTAHIERGAICGIDDDRGEKLWREETADVSGSAAVAGPQEPVAQPVPAGHLTDMRSTICLPSVSGDERQGSCSDCCAHPCPPVLQRHSCASATTFRPTVSCLLKFDVRVKKKRKNTLKR